MSVEFNLSSHLFSITPNLQQSQIEICFLFQKKKYAGINPLAPEFPFKF